MSQEMTAQRSSKAAHEKVFMLGRVIVFGAPDFGPGLTSDRESK